MKDLRLKREEAGKCAKIIRLGTWLWLFLMVINVASWFLINGELADVWAGAMFSMGIIVIVSYTVAAVLLSAFMYAYRYINLKFYEIIMLYLVLLAIVGFCVIYVCPNTLPKFVQLCQIAPSHLGFIIPLGLVVEYLTYVGCTIVRMLLSWRADRHSWRMVNAMIEHNADSDEPYSNDTDGANVAIDGQLSFTAFASYFN